MQIGADYPRPVMVNGYPCRNCDEVSLAKRGQDPAAAAPAAESPAVQFGGSLDTGRAVSGAAAVPEARRVDRFA